ncbi:SCO family protein [Sphingobacterium sp. lm-10]|uniref:SCO family protein n=1 Tax=Sphingobacterium sp. lm-10 TaxID=2944904 RepID=UPI0020227452|nr:SCO family protein [Sphingobacterium sp. lm-10]MCL7988732.1 SCO family protein [Sphingobacterium sp. lm-10]
MNPVIRPMKFSKIIILAIVLFVPGFLYLLMENLGRHEYVKLPIYGQKSLSGEMRRVMGREVPDTLYHQLKPLQLTNWDGRPVSWMQSDSIISVAHLIYNADSAFSDIALDYMDRLATKFASKTSVHLYSITVDPNDNVAVLQKMANRFGDLERRKWHIVGNPSIDMLQYAREQMLLNASRDTKDSTKFLIDDQIILIDGKHRIRGFYPLSQHTELKRLEDEIKLQLVEEVRDNPMRVEKS